MSKIKYITLFSCLVLGVFSCVKEDYFGYSDSANITSIKVSSQNGNPSIDTDTDSIYIEVANGADLSKITIQELTFSAFATADLEEGEVVDFSQGSKTVTVTAESGEQVTWKIHVYEIGSEPQIDNADFSIWHQQNSYLDPGEEDESSAWGTSNPGATFAGLTPNVQRIEPEQGNYAAKLTTRFTFVGAFVNKPIAAGSLFTGDFKEGNISFDDPEASIDFGIPFTAKPTSFSIDYQYQPGPVFMDANQDPLPGEDAGDIYILLERRVDGEVQRVGTAWYRINEANTSMERIMVPFIYGELPSGTPSYMLPKTGEDYAVDGASPTHIKAVFSSSANGAIFEGADGSTLTVDNVMLNY